MKDLDGQNIVITGGAGDIGTAIAVAVASRGAITTLLDVKPFDEAANSIEQIAAVTSREKVKYETLDTTDAVAVAAFFADQDPPDVVVASAGIVDSAPFLDITVEQWDHHISTNLSGAFLITQAAARSMVAAGRPGHIILIGSWVGSVPWPEIAAYSTSKAGLQMLARSAARELAGQQIRVNVVAPGIVNAGMARHQLETEPQYAARVANVIPLGTLQTAEQVGEVTAFLCSDGASYMTGSVVLADGGCSLFQFD